LNRKIVGIITILILCIPFIFSNSLAGTQDNLNNFDKMDKSFFVFMHSSNYSITNLLSGETIINMEGFDSILTPGFPQLPVKTYLVGIPNGAIVKEIEKTDESFYILPGNYEIVYASPIGNDIQQDDYNDFNMIANYSLFPSIPFEYYGIGRLGSYQVVQIRFYPFLYSKAEKTIVHYKDITLKITYELIEEENNISKSTSLIEETASKIFDNYETFSQLKQEISTSTLDEQCSYLIITTIPLENSLQFLKNWREITTENTVKIINISWIESNYEGKDLPEKIRSFLQEKYVEWNLQYVLMVGSYRYVPMRVCYPDKEDHSPNTKTLTDFYYADLTGNWDADNDGYYGERDDDSPDFFPEIFVGRIPFDDPELIKGICQKIINYEQDTGPWKKNALLLGAILYFYNEDNNEATKRTDGSVLMEVLKNNLFEPNQYLVTTMYEKEGINPSSYPCDAPLNQENVIDYWENGYGIVTWNAHGNYLNSIRKYWYEDDGDMVPEFSEIMKPPFIDSDDSLMLKDDQPSIVFSCSCSNSYPESPFNLGASMIDHGAVAFIGSTGISWTSEAWNNREDGGIQSIDYDFFDYLLNFEYTFGKSLYYSLQRYSTHYDWWGWKSYQNIYDFCLYGDPACSLVTYTSYSPPNIPETPSGPSNGKVNMETEFSTSVFDPDGHDIYVKWDWGDGSESDWIGPYPSGSFIKKSHLWDNAGTYNIKIKAMDFIGFESDWSQFSTIQISSPDIDIDRILGGIGTVKLVIKNNGELNESDIEWSIDIKGLLIHSVSSGIVEELLPNESVTVQSNSIFGIGFPKITTSLPAVKKEKTASCILLGPIVIVI